MWDNDDRTFRTHTKKSFRSYQTKCQGPLHDEAYIIMLANLISVEGLGWPVWIELWSSAWSMMAVVLSYHLLSVINRLWVCCYLVSCMSCLHSSRVAQGSNVVFCYWRAPKWITIVNLLRHILFITHIWEHATFPVTNMSILAPAVAYVTSMLFWSKTSCCSVFVCASGSKQCHRHSRRKQVWCLDAGPNIKCNFFHPVNKHWQRATCRECRAHWSMRFTLPFSCSYGISIRPYDTITTIRSILPVRTYTLLGSSYRGDPT